MRERITSLKATAFRGVPDMFEVPLPRGQSIVVFGENGTGKSTIADAVELFLTGRLEFLSREGRSHAVRHIGARDELRTAVEISTTGSLGGRLEYPSLTGWARPIGDGETFILRARTIAEFVDKSKGEKWKALAEILGLQAVDELRLNLQTIANNLDRLALAVETERAQTRQALTRRNIGAFYSSQPTNFYLHYRLYRPSWRA